ncbi:HAD family hydrolase [Nonomuraea jiangxiensis]|uniref:Haloacid dehalogenase superfamily, subfamily IA, variant 3 with third motif having DD or ED/haloacid dehalogenase superfamily, subfamily IA, variant 1 with third motif having Dx(3-4)D or Dx(3-4)E n=1 Tax=Nonomuraea jiangxiensis TaxID=633440 RepID=A0A1G9GE90_9ACTN|nr:HAD family phosphatase [Nonomuraea jiangxiensis]SDK98932.1 haloacid dehalogenase superfamily, subfamily IA, variant 3 with third motif having DD or ED/haloacid dehalogenase superfamily, subfamily IA, variant 1 with third motif having Dx(3-4)D or Dx(3-4)E [Nonomuraea jiangxiensis]
MQAVFFDMDGLLVDSERVWLEIETEVVARLGGQWTTEHQAHLVGGSMERTVAYMLAVSGSEESPATVAGWMVAGMVDRLSRGVRVMPGASELLDALRAEGVPVGLVTSSLKEIADAVLKGVGRDRFDVIVTANDVTRTKPDPEPYLTAARLLGVEPVRCVVLEDSPSGVAAGTAAGCAVVAVPSVLAIDPAPGRLVVASLEEVGVADLRALITV